MPGIAETPPRGDAPPNQPPELTYEKLHQDLDCDCRNLEGSVENTTDSFARRVRNKPPKLKDFRSYHEEHWPLNGSSLRLKCMHRGVTIVKITSTNEEPLKELWAAEAQIKPISHIYCRFKLKAGAGLVWPTMSQDSPRADKAAHHTLLKCDTFGIDKLDILDVFSLK